MSTHTYEPNPCDIVENDNWLCVRMHVCFIIACKSCVVSVVFVAPLCVMLSRFGNGAFLHVRLRWIMAVTSYIRNDIEWQLPFSVWGNCMETKYELQDILGSPVITNLNCGGNWFYFPQSFSTSPGFYKADHALSICANIMKSLQMVLVPIKFASINLITWWEYLIGSLLLVVHGIRTRDPPNISSDFFPFFRQYQKYGIFSLFLLLFVHYSRVFFRCIWRLKTCLE